MAHLGHHTLENVSRILNNSASFQNIVVCSEPFKGSLHTTIFWKYTELFNIRETFSSVTW